MIDLNLTGPLNHCVYKTTFYLVSLLASQSFCFRSLFSGLMFYVGGFLVRLGDYPVSLLVSVLFDFRRLLARPVQEIIRLLARLLASARHIGGRGTDVDHSMGLNHRADY